MSRARGARGRRSARGQGRGARNAESGAAPAGPVFDAKSLQLCAQAQRALEFALAAEVRDEELHELRVAAVTPDPTVRRLRVWLVVRPDAEGVDRAELLRRLDAARGFLRARVADAIHRKRTPELAFELVVQGDLREDEA